MKIRAGFVSNSSSSSFVVAFPSGFKATPANVLAYLFDGRRGGVRVAGDDESVSFPEAATIIAGQMKGLRPNSPGRINEALGGWLPGLPDMSRFQRAGSGAIDSEAWWAACEAYRRAYWEKTRPKLVAGGADLYVFWFSDHNGVEAILERGNTFAKVPHVRISHH